MPFCEPESPLRAGRETTADQRLMAKRLLSRHGHQEEVTEAHLSLRQGAGLPVQS